MQLCQGIDGIAGAFAFKLERLYAKTRFIR